MGVRIPLGEPYSPVVQLAGRRTLLLLTSRLMAGRGPLKPSIRVRILGSQPILIQGSSVVVALAC